MQPSEPSRSRNDHELLTDPTWFIDSDSDEVAGFVKEVLANTGVVTSAGPDDGRSCRPACERFGVKVLDFDGTQDALLHPFDDAGNPHMEYVRQRGSYDDLALDAIFEGFRRDRPRPFRDRTG